MSEYDHEPIPGLPGNLPQGEHILWQGSPEWKMLARTALHVPKIAGYFGLLAVLGLVTGGMAGVLTTVAVGAVALALLGIIAWGSARTTIYTLTNRRVVMRFGIALTKCVNVPMAIITDADLRLHKDGSGDIALSIKSGPVQLGWMQLWPHARPWHFARPKPMLRCIPDAAAIARLLSRALAEAVPGGQVVPVAERSDTQDYIPNGQQVAA